jgi:hypothetical protein
MSDGVVDKNHVCGTFERIELRLNYYGLLQSLIKAGHIPEGFVIEYASFGGDDSTILEVTAKREADITQFAVG